MGASDLFRDFLHKTSLEFEQDIDRLQRLLAGTDSRSRVRMLPFAGYRNAREARVMGRIVRYSEPVEPRESTFSRARAMLAIYNSHEVPDVAVQCQAFGQDAVTRTDEEGYFHFSLPIEAALPLKTSWEAVTLSTPSRQMQASSIEVPILAPGTDDHWGIISDIDDTVIETGPTNFLKNWRRVLAERPQDRIAVPGATTLYGTIAGNHRAPTRPFFYVSSSPWNLYGFLAEFMELKGIPHGPMFLKDIGIDKTKFIKTGHGTHKLEAIRTILGFYPQHRFLLIGDNGQRDVEIYAEAVRSYPDRIGAVFIRDVSGGCSTGSNAERLKEIRRAGVRTFCAAGFAEAVAVLSELGMERPVEVAKAAGEPS